MNAAAPRAAPAGSEIGAWLDAFVRAPAFLAHYPYYAAILARLAPVADPSVKRMAVSLHDGRFYLHINVDSFLSEPQYLRGVLLHEVHHVALGHLSHPKFAGADEPELMDLALEMSANDHIEEPLPDPITWQPYATLGLRKGQSTLERYDRLVAAHRKGALKPREGGAGAGERADDHRFLRRRERDPGAIEQTRQLLRAAAEEAGPELLDDGAPAFVVAGRTAGRLIEELTGTLGAGEEIIDWRAALRMFVARARAPVHTYARPNRRFPSRVGEIPGRTYSPRVIAQPELLVVIDTSMSMERPELAEIARQLGQLAQHARITVVECDAEIARVYPFAGAIFEVEGRGGTDLRPVFEPEFLGAHRPDGIVYFTDGAGPAPEAPAPVPTLWVLTKPLEFACEWGERARFTRGRSRAA